MRSRSRVGRSESPRRRPIVKAVQYPIASLSDEQVKDILGLMTSEEKDRKIQQPAPDSDDTGGWYCGNRRERNCLQRIVHVKPPACGRCSKTTSSWPRAADIMNARTGRNMVTVEAMQRCTTTAKSRLIKPYEEVYRVSETLGVLRGEIDRLYSHSAVSELMKQNEEKAEQISRLGDMVCQLSQSLAVEQEKVAQAASGGAGTSAGSSAPVVMDDGNYLLRQVEQLKIDLEAAKAETRRSDEARAYADTIARESKNELGRHKMQIATLEKEVVDARKEAKQAREMQAGPPDRGCAIPHERDRGERQIVEGLQNEVDRLNTILQNADVAEKMAVARALAGAEAMHAVEIKEMRERIDNLTRDKASMADLELQRISAPTGHLSMVNPEGGEEQVFVREDRRTALPSPPSGNDEGGNDEPVSTTKGKINSYKDKIRSLYKTMMHLIKTLWAIGKKAECVACGPNTEQGKGEEAVFKETHPETLADVVKDHIIRGVLTHVVEMEERLEKLGESTGKSGNEEEWRPVGGPERVPESIQSQWHQRAIEEKDAIIKGLRDDLQRAKVLAPVHSKSDTEATRIKMLEETLVMKDRENQHLRTRLECGPEDPQASGKGDGKSKEQRKIAQLLAEIATKTSRYARRKKK